MGYNYWGNNPPDKPSPYSGLIGEDKINPRRRICDIQAEKSKKVTIPMTVKKKALQLGFRIMKIKQKNVSGGCIM